MSEGNPNIISPTSVKLNEIVNNHVDIFNADELSVLHTAIAELQAYEETTDVPLPVNVDVPYAEQQGDTLHCTMGNWEGQPDNYTYQWKRDGADIGVDSDKYTVADDDVGKTFTCVVTASNATGSTEAPPSNGVVVVAG